MFCVAAEGRRESVYSGIRYIGFCSGMVWKERRIEVGSEERKHRA